ncbi:OLC1v1032697C1 [Oldenlandia corymbosa var. corymbosa]|uniref:OLC1v1032697C1 n=1 Tax=Oldenlandia corymbosa var. corymbosa TaxID=529605 RepID=A0AAV1CPL1_OLDCO|nr:OLC1v1032697C1 [Oldenlandia corymbosa var. corymbosa]
MSATTNFSQNLNLWGVLSVSKRIINAHSRHFLALSVVFLIPLSFSLIVYPTLQNTFFESNSIVSKPSLFISLSYTDAQPTKTQFLLPLFYALFVLLLALFAVATITYSTFHGFYGRPVKLVSSFKSTLYSFLPLLSTFIVSQILLASFGGLLAFVLALIYRSLGLDLSSGSKYSVGFLFLAGIIVGLFVITMQLSWTLGFVVAVVESKWGYEPLRRSSYLLRGMNGVALSMLLLYGSAIGLLAWGCSTSVANAGHASGLMSWAFVLQTVVSSGFITLLMLHNVAANVVLYMYCKALHGELAFEIAEEFACEYVSLPFDYEKVPHVVSIVQV